MFLRTDRAIAGLAGFQKHCDFSRKAQSVRTIKRPDSQGLHVEIVLEIFQLPPETYSVSTVLKERPAGVIRGGQKIPVRLQKINRSIQKTDSGGENPGKPSIAKLRVALGWTRNQLAYVLNASDRAIVNWEAGDLISPVYAAKLREIQNIYNELKQLMPPKEIGPWLLTEMNEFEGRTPSDLISKGETGRLWASLFYMRSGMPD